MSVAPLSPPLRGRALLNDPTLNKGTAFTRTERVALGVDGLLPARGESIQEQCDRVRDKLDRLHDDLERHIFLLALHDTNIVLFYAFVEAHLAELLPVLYTPTVGEACQEFSQIYRRPHGVFLSYPDRDRITAQLDAISGDVDVVVVTDGERILGLGDLGIGGMDIPIGGGLRRSPRNPAPAPVPRAHPELQRRHPGHRSRRPGGHPGRRSGDRVHPCRPDDLHRRRRVATPASRLYLTDADGLLHDRRTRRCWSVSQANPD